MGNHCTNLQGDRNLGAFWERQFCLLAGWYTSHWFIPNQLRKEGAASAYRRDAEGWKRMLLPDVTILSSNCEHHEVKHKNATKHTRCYGLEKYRFDALLNFANTTRTSVLYTIHDYDLAGGKSVEHNSLDHWVTASVTLLAEQLPKESWFNSYVNGVSKRVPGYYWPKALWQPLRCWWGWDEDGIPF